MRLAVTIDDLASSSFRHSRWTGRDLRVMVIQNFQLPASARLVAYVATFTGEEGNERYGLLARREP